MKRWWLDKSVQKEGNSNQDQEIEFLKIKNFLYQKIDFLISIIQILDISENHF